VRALRAEGRVGPRAECARVGPRAELGQGPSARASGLGPSWAKGRVGAPLLAGPPSCTRRCGNPAGGRSTRRARGLGGGLGRPAAFERHSIAFIFIVYFISAKLRIIARLGFALTTIFINSFSWCGSLVGPASPRDAARGGVRKGDPHTICLYVRGYGLPPRIAHNTCTVIATHDCCIR
jgi:hypothetical protein